MSADIWTGDGWEVRHGKWQDSAPDEVDCIIADPPYDERTHENAAHGGFDDARFGGLSFEPFEPKDDLPPLLSKARRWVVCFCTAEHIGRFSEVAGDRWIRCGWWHKPDGTPQMSGDRPAVPGEALAIMHRPGKKQWNGGGHKAYFRHGVERLDRFHETQKPVGLLVELIELFTDPDELVWDPYGGSMTTGVVCLLTGRRFLGHEMQHHYAKGGADRLRATTQGLTLEDYRAGQQPLFDALEAS